jgi:hypothetical protein
VANQNQLPYDFWAVVYGTALKDCDPVYEGPVERLQYDGAHGVEDHKETKHPLEYRDEAMERGRRLIESATRTEKAEQDWKGTLDGVARGDETCEEHLYNELGIMVKQGETPRPQAGSEVTFALYGALAVSYDPETSGGDFESFMQGCMSEVTDVEGRPDDSLRGAIIGTLRSYYRKLSCGDRIAKEPKTSATRRKHTDEGAMQDARDVLRGTRQAVSNVFSGLSHEPGEGIRERTIAELRNNEVWLGELLPWLEEDEPDIWGEKAVLSASEERQAAYMRYTAALTIRVTLQNLEKVMKISGTQRSWRALTVRPPMTCL